MQQIVWNLLSNAVKFTGKGGRIEVRAEHIGSILSITVEDTGRGIEPEYLPYVFETFSQQDPSMTRAHEGIGLGLSIVRSLVDLHGGRIRVTSEGPGKRLLLRNVTGGASAFSSFSPVTCSGLPGDGMTARWPSRSAAVSGDVLIFAATHPMENHDAS